VKAPLVLLLVTAGPVYADDGDDEPRTAVLALDDDASDDTTTDRAPVAEVAPATVAAASDDDDDYVRPEHCHPHPPQVVGEGPCARFGEWGGNLVDPYVFVTAGLNMRTLPATGPALSAARTSGPVSSTSSSTDRVLTFDERFGFGLGPVFYGALDFEIGNFADGGPRDRDVVFGGTAAFGARVPLGRIAIAGELAAGALASGYPDQRSMRTDGVFEARGRADLWLSPWFTLGVTVGTDLTDSGTWMAGLSLGVHSRAFAGRR
jgi:hypothetical protein